MTILKKLKEKAYRIRQNALLMGEVQGQGYVGQALGYADVLAVVYGAMMKFNPANPEDDNRDRFLLSHGHYAIAHYAALMEAGILDKKDIENYGSDDSHLPMSGMACYTPGMEISGGSLGQGLSIGVGIALALKHRQKTNYVFNSMSDGELDEGAVWEAALSASHYKLDNLICLIDVNNQQADGPSKEILNFETLEDKWSAFGWYAQRVNGNDIGAVYNALMNAMDYKDSQPRVIIFDTLMGKGVPFLEKREKNHFIRVDPEEWAIALSELEKNYMEENLSC